MKIFYIGPLQAVRVPLPGGGEATVEYGEPLDTTDTHAQSLLEQESNWQKSQPSGSKSKPPAGKEG